MSSTAKSGIQTDSDGANYIPASTRSDGSTRKEIRVRPGYRPPEDVETYKNKSAESWKNRGSAGVPGAEPIPKPEDNESKSRNAKRRDAARKKAAVAGNDDLELSSALENSRINEVGKLKEDWRDPAKLQTNQNMSQIEEADSQKRIRNALKKLKGVRELKEKKVQGEKLSHDQLMKIAKESELVRDLKKLGYDGPEMVVSQSNGEG